MDKREILQQIIDNQGSCNWLGQTGPDDEAHEICNKCPLSKLKTGPDGRYLSCFDALIPVNVGWREVDDIYLKKAHEVLSDIAIEDMLIGEIDDSNPR